MKKNEPASERAVLVTTQHKGVFFGYATATGGTTIRLRAARLCVYWTADLRAADSWGWLHLVRKKAVASARRLTWKYATSLLFLNAHPKR